MGKTLCILAVVALMVLPLVGCGKSEPKSQADMDKEAESVIKQVQECITDKDFDQADKHLKDLEAARDKYSKVVQDKIGDVRKALDTAKKAAEAIKLPGTS